jgi:hypothetical protein
LALLLVAFVPQALARGKNKIAYEDFDWQR